MPGLVPKTLLPGPMDTMLPKTPGELMCWGSPPFAVAYPVGLNQPVSDLAVSVRVYGMGVPALKFAGFGPIVMSARAVTVVVLPHGWAALEWVSGPRVSVLLNLYLNSFA